MIATPLFSVALVIGAMSGHRADLFAFWDMVEQFRHGGLSLSLLGVNSTARMSDVAVSP